MDTPKSREGPEGPAQPPLCSVIPAHCQNGCAETPRAGNSVLLLPSTISLDSCYTPPSHRRYHREKELRYHTFVTSLSMLSTSLYFILLDVVLSARDHNSTCSTGHKFLFFILMFFFPTTCLLVVRLSRKNIGSGRDGISLRMPLRCRCSILLSVFSIAGGPSRTNALIQLRFHSYF